jgi:hypothetical protein
VTLLAEIILNRTPEEAYTSVEGLLAQSKFRIVTEEAPHKISAIQGSLWGTTAKNAQKNATFTFQEDASGTRAACKSVLTSGYITLTAAGVVFSVALMVICAWMALDLQAYSSTGTAGFWGWLAQTQGSFNPDTAVLFSRLFWFLATFLAATLLVEAVIVVRIKAKINAFAEEILKTLAQQKGA